MGLWFTPCSVAYRCNSNSCDTTTRHENLDLWSGHVTYCRIALVDPYLHTKSHLNWANHKKLFVDVRTPDRLHYVNSARITFCSSSMASWTRWSRLCIISCVRASTDENGFTSTTRRWSWGLNGLSNDGTALAKLGFTSSPSSSTN